MKISTKGRYALRMLLDLAEHQNEGYIALKDIAERQNISKKYLEQIVAIFNRSDILKTNRGYQGGYMLAKSPDKYSVAAWHPLPVWTRNPTNVNAARNVSHSRYGKVCIRSSRNTWTASPCRTSSTSKRP